MLNNALASLNPFNMYGTEVKLEDLVSSPLQSNETLMGDSRGAIHRIKVPTNGRFNILERLVFWIQTHVNMMDNLHAIDKLISSFEQEVLKTSRTGPETLATNKEKLKSFESLKNDYQLINRGDDAVKSVTSRITKIADQLTKIESEQVEEQKRQAEAAAARQVEEAKQEAARQVRLQVKTFQDDCSTLVETMGKGQVERKKVVPELLTARQDQVESLVSKVQEDIQSSLRSLAGLMHKKGQLVKSVSSGLGALVSSEWNKAIISIKKELQEMSSDIQTMKQNSETNFWKVNAFAFTNTGHIQRIRKLAEEVQTLRQRVN